MIDELTAEVRQLGAQIGVVEAMLPHILKSTEKQTEILEKIAVQQEKSVNHERRLSTLASDLKDLRVDQKELRHDLINNQIETKANTVRVALVISIVMVVVGLSLKHLFSAV